MEPVIHHHVIDRLAFVNGLVSGIALYPQVWNVLAHESAANISTLTYTLILLNSLVWVMYAVHRGLLSLGIASLLNALASAALLLAVWVF
jgi:uncharacterized protein with PQ loop repeat